MGKVTFDNVTVEGNFSDNELLEMAIKSKIAQLSINGEPSSIENVMELLKNLVYDFEILDEKKKQKLEREAKLKPDIDKLSSSKDIEDLVKTAVMIMAKYK